MSLQFLWLQGAWAGIFYAWRILWIDHFIVNGDSTTVVTLIQRSMRGEDVHPLHDIAVILRCYTSILVRHIYRKANFITDWIATYVIEYSGDCLWTDMKEIMGILEIFCFSIFFLDVFMLD